MRENTEQKKAEHGHFLCSDITLRISLELRETNELSISRNSFLGVVQNESNDDSAEKMCRTFSF